MTQQRRDNHSTEFGLWLRNQSSIDSSFGYVATNIDYFWENWKTGKWMLIEEKRYLSDVKFYQQRIFKILDECAKGQQGYQGFHILKFENSSPDDGKIYLDDREITKEELLEFLEMK